ncbi:MAG: hypothetical protein WCS37_10445 [Chloroflexota bacterium]
MTRTPVMIDNIFWGVSATHHFYEVFAHSKNWVLAAILVYRAQN